MPELRQNLAPALSSLFVAWRYNSVLVTAMTGECRIETDGAEFIVIDDEGETVGVCFREEAAQRDIERCKK